MYYLLSILTFALANGFCFSFSKFGQLHQENTNISLFLQLKFYNTKLKTNLSKKNNMMIVKWMENSESPVKYGLLNWKTEILWNSKNCQPLWLLASKICSWKIRNWEKKQILMLRLSNWRKFQILCQLPPWYFVPNIVLTYDVKKSFK